MKLIPIIQRIREKCPVFRDYVGGLAQWRGMDDLRYLQPEQLPVAWVIPASDSPTAPLSANGVRQDVTEGFSVYVAMSVEQSQRGEIAVDAMDEIRDGLMAALVGLRPYPEKGYGPIYYAGGSEIYLKNDALLVMRYTFASARQFHSGIARGDVLTAQDDELSNLPPLERIFADVDVYPPDGRPEAGMDLQLEGGAGEDGDTEAR